MNITEVLGTVGVSAWLPLVVFVFCFIDGFFPPIPSETAVMSALTLALAAGAPPVLVASIFVAAAIGASSGDLVAYGIGRASGTSRWAWTRRPRIRAALDWAEKQVAARPAVLILGARYIPIGRVAVNMTAGATRLPLRRFLPLSILAGATWAGMCWVLATIVSAWLGHNALLATAVAVAISIVLGIAVEGISRLVRALRARRSAQQASADDDAAAIQRVGSLADSTAVPQLADAAAR